MSTEAQELPQVAERLDPAVLAIVEGKNFTETPKDLYIPPDALEVILETFQGPLDLLLYLIRRRNLDILDIPVAKITSQYMRYIELMQELRLELAAEYLVMAAILAEIKSRLLLPKTSGNEEDEEDPRAELVRRLQEYERFKRAAEDLDAQPRYGRDVLPVTVDVPPTTQEKPRPDLVMKELLLAFHAVLQRADRMASHNIARESLSLRERMTQILARLQKDKFFNFTQLFTAKEGRPGVVVTFIAVLELMKQSLIEIIQTEINGPIHVQVASHE